MTEIMCTLSGEQIADPALVNALANAGMTAVRINTAHLDGASSLGRLARGLKALLPKIKILIDTKGPEMRSTVDRELILNEGDILSIAGCETDGMDNSRCITVNYPEIHTAVEAGDVIMIDDGKICVEAVTIDGTNIKARVIRGGVLGARKGMSIFGKEPDLPAVGIHDLEYIRYACASDDIDIIAHSFVRRGSDVAAVKEAMGECAKPVIAKIENPQGITNLDEIAAEADGLLIARGDLTATLGADAVPEAQAKIAAVARHHCMPLYLATGILPSMMDSTTPSEDDIRRIGIALKQGVDTMLLTNETATGKFPLESVAVLAKAVMMRY
ncbi:MAG: hypothetical protein K2K05_04355 [Muribaculaceae bacterium]|nr:hypothetical protein [Muribaculaceae bacterium]